MASGNLKTSTPLQRRYDSGFGSFVDRCYTPHSKEIELSPIRKQPSRIYNFTVPVFNKILIKPFEDICKRSLLTSSDGYKSHSVSTFIDSGIASDNTSSINESLCEAIEHSSVQKLSSHIYNLSTPLSKNSSVVKLTPVDEVFSSSENRPITDKNLCAITESSPIKKQSSLGLPDILQAHNYLKTSGIKKLNSQIDKVSKTLTSPDANDFKSSTGSRIVCDNIPKVNEELHRKLTSFPKDENHNFIYGCCKLDKLHQPYKYICAEDIDGKELDHDINANLYTKSDSIGVILDNIHTSLSKFDILKELNIRNCTNIISCIFSYLSEEELLIISCVCKEWQNMVLNDRNAHQRKKIYINNKKNKANGCDKENKDEVESVGRNHKSAFTNVLNISLETVQPLPYANFYGKFDAFLEESRILEEKQPLEKCPRCQYPSRAQYENKFCCTRKLCQHEFCKKCSGPYLNNHLCLVPELNSFSDSITIGSKKSKKNLRRL